MIFVDTNVLMYAVGRPHPLRAQARGFFEDAQRRQESLATSAEVLQELLHAYLPVGRSDTLDAALELAESAIGVVWAVEEADVRFARLLASRHAGLGAEAYLTLTSPIRRFYDLLIEKQVLEALRGSPVLNDAQLEEIINRVGPAIAKVGLVEELTEQYWILRYLEKRIGSTTPAMILDRFPNKCS